ncbi:endonuclease V [Streptomyces sp. ZYX-F-203]
MVMTGVSTRPARTASDGDRVFPVQPEAKEGRVTREPIEEWEPGTDRQIRAAASRVPEIGPRSISRLIGVDVAYCDSRGAAVAAGVAWDRTERRTVLVARRPGRPPVPYRFGRLGRREAGMAEGVVRDLVRDGDVVMCDGHGLMHPERMGLGVHLAARLARPVVAVAKNPLRREMPNTPAERGSVRMISDSEGIVGAEVRTADGVRPVYVSVGGGMSLDCAIQLTLEAARYRIPEPLRSADHEARKGIREISGVPE